MKLSAPIYQLRRQARLLSRDAAIPLHEALQRVALQEGFSAWSMLAANFSKAALASKIYSRLKPGDLLLLGARPGQGKTRMSLELMAEAIKSGNRGAFFTLEYTEKSVFDLLRTIGIESGQLGDLFHLDASDAICADHIVSALASTPSGTFVVVDYLQLLDQKRQNPDLTDQVRILKAFALERGLIVAVISQIDRSFDKRQRRCPGIRDVRLPNPLDLRLFNKTCFIHEGSVHLRATSS